MNQGAEMICTLINIIIIYLLCPPNMALNDDNEVYFCYNSYHAGVGIGGGECE